MSYQALELNGSGYAGIAHASQSGLNMGLSDFMVEVVPKTTNTGSNRRMVSKYSATDVGWVFHMNSSGKLVALLVDGVNDASVLSTPTINNGRWDDAVWVVDRSSSTGSKLFIGGSEVAYDTQEDPTGVLTLDNTVAANIGTYKNGQQNWVGFLDEVRVWNFGYGGLPADYTTYITWRAAGRNRFLDISSYNSGAWNGYADADRTEKLTDGGIENWTGDDPNSWSVAGGIVADETTTKHGGSHSAKVTNNTGGAASTRLYQTSVSVVQNEWYELSAWIYFPSANTSAANVIVRFEGGTLGEAADTPCTTEDAWTRASRLVRVTDQTTSTLVVRYTDISDGDLFYIDDISVKRVGLVAHYKFNGNYTDETTNSNDLTAGGTGNAFPGYTLKRDKIIAPDWVR